MFTLLGFTVLTMFTGEMPLIRAMVYLLRLSLDVSSLSLSLILESLHEKKNKGKGKKTNDTKKEK